MSSLDSAMVRVIEKCICYETNHIKTYNFKQFFIKPLAYHTFELIFSHFQLFAMIKINSIHLKLIFTESSLPVRLQVRIPAVAFLFFSLFFQNFQQLSLFFNFPASI